MSTQLAMTENKKKLAVYIFLIVVTTIVYWQVNKFDFINYDDNIYVSENPVIQSGLTLPGFLWALGSNYYHLWNPLVWLSFMFDYEVYGLNAGGYHITNLILHILSSLLLFWLFCRMTGAIWKSAFVAVLFSLHPFHVESVAWIAERKDVLSTFFWMLTLCLYVYYTEKPAIKIYLLIVFSFAFALMSKPFAIYLPIIMILLDYWPLKRFELRKDNHFLWQIKEKAPFLILAIIVFIVNLYINFYNADKNEPASLVSPLSSRLASASVAFITYLGKTFWPHDMVVFYPFPSHIPLWQIQGAFLLIIVVTTFIILTIKRMPYLFVGWLWFTIIITPVIVMIQTPKIFFMADRYHYLPSIGIGVMLAWGIPLLFKHENMRKKILFPATIVFFFILALLAWKQCGYWRGDITLWNHALSLTNNNYMAHNNLADALLKKGKTDKAIYHYDKAISINHYAAAYYNKGVICYRQGQFQQAVMNFHEAIRANPDYAEAYYNLGIIYHSSGQYQSAIMNYSEAIRIMPQHIKAYNNRAFIYLNMGNNISGCSDAQKACSMGSCQTLIWAKGNGLCN